MLRRRSTSPFSAILAVAALVTAAPTSADSKADAVIGKLGLACKNRVIEQFEVISANVTVRLGATVQESLDSGEMTTDDIERDGASFDWSVRGNDASGYCNVNGSGEVEDFEQW